MDLGVDREVVMAHGPDEEGAVERDRPGIVRLVAERASRRCRDRVGRVFAVVGVLVVGGQVVVPGDASGDVGPVITALRRIRVEPVLGVSRSIRNRSLVGVGGIVDRHTGHDAEVRVVRDDGGAVRTGVIEDGLADSTFGSVKSDAVGTGGLEGSLRSRCARNQNEAGEGEPRQCGGNDSTHGNATQARRLHRAVGQVATHGWMVFSVGTASILDAALHVSESHTAPTLLWLPAHHNNGT